MKKFLLILLLLFLSLLFWTKNKAKMPWLPTTYHLLDAVDGARLYKTQLLNGNKAYLQIIDLRKMRIDQIINKIETLGTGQGKYYLGEGKFDSPYFEMKLFPEVWENYKKNNYNQVFSLINGVFFEEYKSSTQLSFPVKLNGQFLTGGSSSYGPCKNPADVRYKTIKLKALIWDEKSASITDYNPESGYPLNKATIQNGIVSYRYSDHPAKVLLPNPPNRYHVIGTLNKDGISGDELLLIVTVDQATLDESADLLRQLGVRGEILTIDGGSSTLLSNPRTGELIIPAPKNMQNNPNAWKLPHYLGFRKK